MEPELPFIGMVRELQRLRSAFTTGDPLLLLGPQGNGKTRLTSEALSGNQHVLYITWEPTLHALLTAMARALIAVSHAGFIGRAKPGADPESWLAAQTSVHLKGLLWTAVERSPVTMILDGITGASFPTYRFLQRIYHTPGMALFAASRDAFSLGALARLFWNPANALNIPPLHERDAEQLFESAVDHFGFQNRERAGTFRDAMLPDGTTDLASTRRPGTKKYGFGLNVEQEITRDIGAFARYGWSDGKTEAWAFTQIDRSVSGGISSQGRLWKRTGDNICIAAVRNYLAGDDRNFLAAGGVGFIVGDGRLNYAPESITEAYYAWHPIRDWTFTLDYQRIVNPAYNRDRGPVSVGTLRVHWER